MNAWALTKVLDQLATERKTNYYTVDFFQHSPGGSHLFKGQTHPK